MEQPLAGYGSWRNDLLDWESEDRLERISQGNVVCAFGNRRTFALILDDGDDDSGKRVGSNCERASDVTYNSSPSLMTVPIPHSVAYRLSSLRSLNTM